MRGRWSDLGLSRLCGMDSLAQASALKRNPAARVQRRLYAACDDICKAMQKPLLTKLVITLRMQALWSGLEQVSIDFAMRIQVWRRRESAVLLVENDNGVVAYTEM